MYQALPDRCRQRGRGWRPPQAPVARLGAAAMRPRNHRLTLPPPHCHRRLPPSATTEGDPLVLAQQQQQRTRPSPRRRLPRVPPVPRAPLEATLEQLRSGSTLASRSMQQHGAAQDAPRRCRRCHLAPRLDRMSPHKAWAEAPFVVQRLLQLPPLQRAEAAGAAYGGSGVVCRAVHHFAFAACWQALRRALASLGVAPPLRVHKHLTPSESGEEGGQMHAKHRSVGIPSSRQWNQVIDTTRSEDSPLAAEESTCARPYNRNRTENRTIHDHYGLCIFK